MSELPATFESKIEGRNALVTIHADRVEYQRRGFGSKRATDIILLRHVSSVSMRKDGVGKSSVVVRSGTQEVEFRQRRERAQEMRDLLLRLVVAR